MITNPLPQLLQLGEEIAVVVFVVFAIGAFALGTIATIMQKGR